MPGEQDIPSTLRRSPRKAQETFVKAHDAALESYGDSGGRARRVAFAALKHSFEKVGDHWEPKPGRGASDAQARRGYGERPTRTAGGVDANASKQHLLEVAERLNVRDRDSMTKPQLVDAIEKANARETSRARSRRQ
ncbi:MAG TPA: ChaB family protein [Micromonosporaceae bacterium]|jgi:cation transport regulator ChaB